MQRTTVQPTDAVPEGNDATGQDLDAPKASETESEPQVSNLFAPVFPNLAPTMLLPRGRRSVFPLNAPSIHYYYLARNAIYALCLLWELKDQEVVFPAYFHGVELEVLLSAGVRPTFYPVRDRMRVDPEEVVARITPRTKAVYLIHYLGFPGPVREIAEVCKQRGILLIEDCALALLSKLGNKPLGSFADAAIFCFYKTVPVPNGGALVLKDRNTAAPQALAPPPRAALSTMFSSMFTHFEIRGKAGVQSVMRAIRGVSRRVLRRTSSEEWVNVGTNHFEPEHARFGMSRFNHMVLAGQNYARIAERRRGNFARLLEKVRGLSPPIFDHLPEGTCPLFFPVIVREKHKFRRALAERGVETVDFWSLTNPVVPKGEFPEVERMRRSIVELPCQQDLSDADMDRIGDAVIEAREYLGGE